VRRCSSSIPWVSSMNAFTTTVSGVSIHDVPPSTRPRVCRVYMRSVAKKTTPSPRACGAAHQALGRRRPWRASRLTIMRIVWVQGLGVSGVDTSRECCAHRGHLLPSSHPPPLTLWPLSQVTTQCTREGRVALGKHPIRCP
jgi:hypothetical protein